jgi:hypothetical protein
MGLAVVARLAARHDVTVRLDRRSPHGTVATVLLPTGIVTELAERAWSGTRTVTAEPVKAEGHGEPVTVGGLPRRRPGAFPREEPAAPMPRKPTPRPRPVEQSGGTTANGLPRRVPGSIRGAAPEPPPPPPAVPTDTASGHDKLLADLGAFADGEQAALSERNHTPHDETPGGSAS